MEDFMIWLWFEGLEDYEDIIITSAPTKEYLWEDINQIKADMLERKPIRRGIEKLAAKTVDEETEPEKFEMACRYLEDELFHYVVGKITEEGHKRIEEILSCPPDYGILLAKEWVEEV